MREDKYIFKFGENPLEQALRLSSLLSLRGLEHSGEEDYILYKYSIISESNIVILEFKTDTDGEVYNIYCDRDAAKVEFTIVRLAFELESNEFPDYYQYTEKDKMYKCTKMKTTINSGSIEKEENETIITLGNKTLLDYEIGTQLHEEDTYSIEYKEDMHGIIKKYVFYLPGEYTIAKIDKTNTDQQKLAEFDGFIALIKDDYGERSGILESKSLEQYIVLLKNDCGLWSTFCATGDCDLTEFDVHTNFVLHRKHYEIPNTWTFKKVWGLKLGEISEKSVYPNYTWESFLTRVEGKSIDDLRERVLPPNQIPANPLLDMFLVYELVDPVCDSDKEDYINCIQDYIGEKNV